MKIIYFFKTVFFGFYLLIVIFRYMFTYLDLDFYKSHKLKLFEVYLYKTLEILLTEQYARRHNKYSEKRILKCITDDLVYIYAKYFKVKEK